MDAKPIAKVVDRAHGAIDPAEGIAAVSDPGFGGIDVFIGKVRDVNVGRVVTGITYDLFEPLVLNEIQRLAAEVEAAFGPRLKLYVAHARGGWASAMWLWWWPPAAAPGRSIPRVPAADRGSEAPVPDLEAGTLRGWRQRLERGLQPVPCGQHARTWP